MRPTRRRLTTLLCVSLAAACSGEAVPADPNAPPAPAAPEAALEIDFEDAPVGAPPGFAVARTGRGGAAGWEVVEAANLRIAELPESGR